MKTEELKRRNLQEKGITLVALVVTIIILLILAGVTLNLALGEGGIFARAKNTVDRYQAAQANELDQMTQLEEMLNSYGQGETGTGGTGDPTPPTTSGGIESSEVSGELKKYQGKYVDIGLEINDNSNTADDWKLFYATEDRIFLIAADYVPATKLAEWGIIGDTGTLKNNGFQQYSTDKYSVNWSTPTTFLEEGLADLDLVMHTKYDLNSNSDKYNSIAVSHLLNTTAWEGVKNAAGKKTSIDFVIGGPTLEMWCAAWDKAIEGDADFREIEADPQASSYGYKVKSITNSSDSLYVSSSGSRPDSDKLEKYSTFFLHEDPYWLASPSAYDSGRLMRVDYDGCVNGYSDFSDTNLGVRPVICLTSGVKIVEKENAENIYDLAM